jgi:ornithine cyclodeaminase/alanine dehydrogenase-like protein (mu-crystallin family)
MRYSSMSSHRKRVTTLTEDEVRSRLDPARLLAAIEEAFRSRYPHALIPLRTQMRLAEGVFFIMPCFDRQNSSLGMKLVTVLENPPTPEQKIQATYLVLDPRTGAVVASMSAAYLTDLRTAAASALATKYLAREDVRVLGIFGTGRQARSHLRVLRLVRKFERFLVSGIDHDQSVQFAQEMAHEFGAPVEAVYSRACASESDVLCTCTTSKTPLFDGHLLRPGTHVNCIGAFQPNTREVDSVTVLRSRVVVDTYEGAFAEAGDLLMPMNEGVITRAHILADLHELLSRKKTVRRNPQEITLFKSVGVALEDLAAAEIVVAPAT